MSWRITKVVLDRWTKTRRLAAVSSLLSPTYPLSGALCLTKSYYIKSFLLDGVDRMLLDNIYDAT